VSQGTEEQAKQMTACHVRDQEYARGTLPFLPSAEKPELFPKQKNGGARPLPM
jgi:hypothetical protein